MKKSRIENVQTCDNNNNNNDYIPVHTVRSTSRIKKLNWK